MEPTSLSFSADAFLQGSAAELLPRLLKVIYGEKYAGGVA